MEYERASHSSSVEHIDPHIVLLQCHLLQLFPQSSPFELCDIELEYGVVYTKSVRFQQIGDFRTAFCIGNIVCNEHKHTKLYRNGKKVERDKEMERDSRRDTESRFDT
jgi:hypothetical protein